MHRALMSITAMLAAIVFLAGCGGSSSSGPATFVSRTASEVATISWTDDGSGHLTGSLQTATPNSAGTGELLTSVSVPFTGTLHADQISVVVGGQLGATATWTGALSGDTVTLTIPQADGTLAPAIFSRGTVADYNAAVSKFQEQVTQSRSAAAAAAASAARDAASAEAAAALAAVGDRASAAVDALEAGIAAPPSFDAFTADMTTLKQDLATTLTHAATATAEGRSSDTACGDASTAQGDASTVEGDQSTIEGDAADVQGVVDEVGRLAQDVRTALSLATAAYQAQGVSMGSHGTRSQDALSRAETAKSSWSATAAGYVSTARQLAGQATAAANAAARAVC